MEYVSLRDSCFSSGNLFQWKCLRVNAYTVARMLKAVFRTSHTAGLRRYLCHVFGPTTLFRRAFKHTVHNSARAPRRVRALPGQPEEQGWQGQGHEERQEGQGQGRRRAGQPEEPGEPAQPEQPHEQAGRVGFLGFSL